MCSTSEEGKDGNSEETRCQAGSEEGHRQAGSQEGSRRQKARSEESCTGQEGSRRQKARSEESRTGQEGSRRQKARSEESCAGQEACCEEGGSGQACAGSRRRTRSRTGGTGHQAFRALNRSGTAQSETG